MSQAAQAEADEQVPPSEDPDSIVHTQFWQEVMHDVFGPRQGGATIFVDAENARKGVGKTSAAVALARLFARAFRYDLQHDDLTLSGIEYLQRYQKHPSKEQPSILVLDEFVGAGAGDKRRAMSHQNVDFGRAWQMLRTKRVVTFATVPDWNEADKRLRKLADYRVWCRERPIGTFQAYKIEVPFDSGGAAFTRTRGLNYHGSGARRIGYPNMDGHADPFYRSLSKKKDDLIQSSTWDADELLKEGESSETPPDPDTLRRQEAIKYAVRLYEPWDSTNEVSQEQVANEVLGGDYSSSWVGDRVREWREGQHRDLVPDPSEE